MNTKIFQFIKNISQTTVLKTNCSAFYTMKYFCCMKTETGSIAKRAYSASLVCFSKSMSRIINYLQFIFVRNSLNFFHVADISIDMYRHNRTGTVCNQILQFVCINRKRYRIYITEN